MTGSIRGIRLKVSRNCLNNIQNCNKIAILKAVIAESAPEPEGRFSLLRSTSGLRLTPKLPLIKIYDQCIS